MNITPSVVFAGAVALWAISVLTVALATVYKRWKLVSRHQKRVSVSLEKIRCLMIRPCAGEEPHLERCLTSIAEAHYSFKLDVVLGVNGKDDTALCAIQAATRKLNEVGIRSRVHIAPIFGPNRKVTILEGCVMTSPGSYDAVLNADSNIDLAGVNLDELVSPLIADSGTGAVWMPPIETSGHGGLGNLASEAIINGSWHSFSLLSAIDPKGMVGKLFSVKQSALDRIGGFGSLVHYLGEDMALVQNLAQAGYRVEALPNVVTSLSSAKSFRETVDRHARWMMVVRGQRPGLLASYPLLLCSTPVIVALSLLAVPFQWQLGLACIVLVLTARSIIGSAARRASKQSLSLGSVATDAALSDVALIIAFLRALRTRTVSWRGVLLRVDQNGMLRDI